MSKYICNLCEYKSDKKTDYSRHMISKRHLEKVNKTMKHTNNIPKTYIDKEKAYKCLFCGNTYSNSSSLARHKKACNTKEELIKEKDIIISENKVNILQKEIEHLHQQLKKTEKQVDTYETMLKSITGPQTITNFNYISNNYPDTPALEGRKSYTNMIEAKTLFLIDVITMYYYDKKLVNFIGDYIIRYYKKEEPKNQSLWSTDISRLTYIISESCKKKGHIWSYDKKGSKTKKIIIEPALDFIRENLVKFCQDNGWNTETHILKQMIAANGTIVLIDSGELANDIAKYIAPEFAVKQIEESK